MIVAQNTLKKPLFYEVQHFRQVWVLLVVLAISGLQWTAAIRQFLLGKPFGQNPMPDNITFIYWISFGIGLPILFLCTRLVTEVREDGLYFRLIPFHKSFRKIAFEDLDHCKPTTFHAIREYGGWGIRWRPKGKAYIMSGRTGMQCVIKNGKKILIGTQKAEVFWKALPEEVRK